MFCIWLFSEGVTTADNDNPSDETENTAVAVIVPEPENGKSNQSVIFSAEINPSFTTF